MLLREFVAIDAPNVGRFSSKEQIGKPKIDTSCIRSAYNAVKERFPRAVVSIYLYQPDLESLYHSGNHDIRTIRHADPDAFVKVPTRSDVDAFILEEARKVYEKSCVRDSESVSENERMMKQDSGFNPNWKYSRVLIVTNDNYDVYNCDNVPGTMGHRIPKKGELPISGVNTAWLKKTLWKYTFSREGCTLHHIPDLPPHLEALARKMKTSEFHRAAMAAHQMSMIDRSSMQAQRGSTVMMDPEILAKYARFYRVTHPVSKPLLRIMWNLQAVMWKAGPKGTRASAVLEYLQNRFTNTNAGPSGLAGPSGTPRNNITGPSSIAKLYQASSEFTSQADYDLEPAFGTMGRSSTSRRPVRFGLVGWSGKTEKIVQWIEEMRQSCGHSNNGQRFGGNQQNVVYPWQTSLHRLVDKPLAKDEWEDIVQVLRISATNALPDPRSSISAIKAQLTFLPQAKHIAQLNLPGTPGPSSPNGGTGLPSSNGETGQMRAGLPSWNWWCDEINYLLDTVWTHEGGHPALSPAGKYTSIVNSRGGYPTAFIPDKHGGYRPSSYAYPASNNSSSTNVAANPSGGSISDSGSNANAVGSNVVGKKGSAKGKTSAAPISSIAAVGGSSAVIAGSSTASGSKRSNNKKKLTIDTSMGRTTSQEVYGFGVRNSDRAALFRTGSIGSSSDVEVFPHAKSASTFIGSGAGSIQVDTPRRGYMVRNGNSQNKRNGQDNDNMKNVGSNGNNMGLNNNLNATLGSNGAMVGFKNLKNPGMAGNMGNPGLAGMGLGAGIRNGPYNHGSTNTASGRISMLSRISEVASSPERLSLANGDVDSNAVLENPLGRTDGLARADSDVSMMSTMTTNNTNFGTNGPKNGRPGTPAVRNTGAQRGLFLPRGSSTGGNVVADAVSGLRQAPIGGTTTGAVPSGKISLATDTPKKKRKRTVTSFGASSGSDKMMVDATDVNDSGSGTGGAQKQVSTDSPAAKNPSSATVSNKNMNMSPTGKQTTTNNSRMNSSSLNTSMNTENVRSLAEIQALAREMKAQRGPNPRLQRQNARNFASGGNNFSNTSGTDKNSSNKPSNNPSSSSANTTSGGNASSSSANTSSIGVNHEMDNNKRAEQKRKGTLVIDDGVGSTDRESGVDWATAWENNPVKKRKKQ